MKKNLLYHFFLLAAFAGNSIINGDDDCSCDVTSHTYFSVRPQFDVGTPEYLSLNKYQRWQNDQTDHGVSFQVVPFGGRSTKSSKLGKFFMPFCSNEATVDGNVALSNDSLFPQNFNIFSVRYSPTVAGIIGLTAANLPQAFTGVIRVNPEQRVAGVGFAYHQQACYGNIPFFWSVSMPVVHIKNNMNLEEIVTNSSVYTVPVIAGMQTNLNSPFTSMTDALKQNGWLYGKIDNQSHSKTQLAFIQVKAGTSWRCENSYILDPFFGITIPTAKAPNAEYIFNPTVGNGGHFGVLGGTGLEIFLWENSCENIDLTFNADVVMQYLFKKTQRRSIDLKNKPWSRYIEVYNDSAQATLAFNTADALSRAFLASPGINILTQELKVKPGFNLALNMALALNHNYGCHGFNAELGYNFYAKQAECVSLNKPFSTQAAIKDHTGRGLTNPVRDITESQLLNEASILNLDANGAYPGGIEAAYDRGIILQEDLNLASAAHPAVLTHTVYGAFGYHWDDTLCVPVFSGIGASYEFSKANSGLNRWLVWGKFGLSF